MAEEGTSEFFVPDTKGDSQSVYKTLANLMEALQSSQIKARNRDYKQPTASPVMLDGIPGCPFEGGSPNPDLFFQGEDIIYDVFLFHEGAPVSIEDYDIAVSVKTSPRAAKPAWVGTYENGVFTVVDSPGRYELWIPSSITEKFLAGTYYLNIQIKERIAGGEGRYDRRYILLETYFNIDYSNFSPFPETVANVPGKLDRTNAEATWPNTPNTIGNVPLIPDAFYLNNSQ